MAILGYQDNFNRVNVENSQKLALFRYFLIPFAIFLTVVPTGILSLIQQYQQNQSVLTYTTIISQEFQGIIPNSESLSGIVLTPKLTLSGDFVCVMCAWIIALIGIFSSLRKNNLVGQFISIFLIAFTVLQTFSAIYTVAFNDQWIFGILSGSWKKLFYFDSELIKEFQCEFSCKGYASVDDRLTNIPNQFDECCNKVLINRYGTYLFDEAKIMLLTRFVQLFGVLIHAHIFNRVILHDMMVIYAEDCDVEYYYDDKEYYNNYISSDDFEDYDEDQDDDQDCWIDPTPPLLLSKIYFSEQSS